MQQTLNELNAQAIQVQQMVDQILNGQTSEIDNYVTFIKTKIDAKEELTNEEVNKIMLKLPLFMYHLSAILQQLDLRKGLSEESKNFVKNKTILESTGTAQVKDAMAATATSEHQIILLAYKNAVGIVNGKLQVIEDLLGSVKKVQNMRIAEMELANKTGGGAII